MTMLFIMRVLRLIVYCSLKASPVSVKKKAPKTKTLGKISFQSLCENCYHYHYSIITITIITIIMFIIINTLGEKHSSGEEDP